MESEELLTGLVSSRDLEGSQGILPRLRSAVTQGSAYLQGFQGSMAEPYPYSNKGPEEAQIIMLCLNVCLKAYLCKMRDSIEMQKIISGFNGL